MWDMGNNKGVVIRNGHVEYVTEYKPPRTSRVTQDHIGVGCLALLLVLFIYQRVRKLLKRKARIAESRKPAISIMPSSGQIVFTYPPSSMREVRRVKPTPEGHG